MRSNEGQENERMKHTPIIVKELTDWVEQKLSEPIIYGTYASAPNDINVKLGWLPRLNKWFVDTWRGTATNRSVFANPQDAIDEYEKIVWQNKQ